MSDLAETLSRVARTLEPEPDVEKTVGHIVAAVAATVPGTEEAGVSLLESRKMRSVSPSSETVARLDRLQHDLEEGPCVDAALHAHTYRTGAIGDDTRWPRFGKAAAELGIASMLGVRLFTSRTTIGSLNLYSSQPEAFDDDAQHVAELFAAHAAVALAGSQRQAQLHNAIQSRDIISTAKGILMERHRIDGERAFGLLVSASQETNMKLRDVANWLVTEANTAAETATDTATDTATSNTAPGALGQTPLDLPD